MICETLVDDSSIVFTCKGFKTGFRLYMDNDGDSIIDFSNTRPGTRFSPAQDYRLIKMEPYMMVQMHDAMQSYLESFRNDMNLWQSRATIKRICNKAPISIELTDADGDWVNIVMSPNPAGTFVEATGVAIKLNPRDIYMFETGMREAIEKFGWEPPPEAEFEIV